MVDTEHYVTYGATLHDTMEGVKDVKDFSSVSMGHVSSAAKHHPRTTRHSLWTAKLIVIHVAPLVYVYDTMVPLLEETMTVLACRVTEAEEVMSIV